MSNLMSFLFNTIRVRAIDPANARFFLPTVLSGITGDNSKDKLLPIEQKTWSLGSIKGPEGATITQGFRDNWATYLERVEKVDLSSQYPIANPANPFPNLSFGDGVNKVIIDGLQNVFVLPAKQIDPTHDGYAAKLHLQLNYWDGQGGRPNITKLTVSGPYKLMQSLCVAENGAQVCNGVASADLAGDGTVKLSIDTVFVDASVVIAIAAQGAHGRSTLVRVTGLTARGPDADTAPSITVDELTIGANVSDFLRTIWKTAATNAIESADGRAGVLANLNTALNTPANLDALSAKMTEKLASMIDGVIGHAPASLPTGGAATLNPVDRYLFDRTRFGLNDPASRVFLPTVLANSKSPSLNPLVVPHIDLPDFTALVPFQHNVLTNLMVSGLANVRAPANQLSFAGDALQFTGNLGGWNPPPHVPSGPQIPPPPVKGTAQFSLTPSGQPQALTGGIDLKVNAAQLTGESHFSGDSDSTLTLDLHRLAVQAADPVADLHVAILAESQFKTFIDQSLNTAGILGKILSDINAQLSHQLAQISANLTKYIRQAIAGGLK